MLTPLERVVGGTFDVAESLAAELGKPKPALTLIGGEIGFNPAFCEALKSSLMHIVRNSLDHGIEAAQDRLAAGKPERGLLRIEAREQGDGVRLLVRDDGRGLALKRLLEKGRAAGVLSPQREPTRQEIADLIFHAGLSTAAAVTQVSGRGVGMDAVRAFLGEQGAKIHIELDEGGGSADFAPFSFIIEVPHSATHT